MMKPLSTTLLATTAVALAGIADAAIIETKVFTEADIGNTVGAPTYTYDGNASSADLIDASSAALASATSSLPGTWPASGVNDGSATGGGPGGDYAYWNNQTTVTLTYELTGSATGYDITSINSIYGWLEGRRHAAQNYSVWIATVGNPTYTLLHTVDYDPSNIEGTNVASQVTLTDDSGTLATGVTGIRFVAIRDADGLYDEVGVIHEIDVFGNASVPEPSSLALLGLGGLLIARRRRD